MRKRLGKKYIVDLLRRAYLTRDTASALYDVIADDIRKQLQNGETISLFGVVNLVPYKNESKTFKGFHDVVVDDKHYRVKPVLNQGFKNYLRELNKEDD